MRYRLGTLLLLRVTEVPVAGGQLTPLHIELETAPYEESKPDIVRRGSAVVDEHTVEEPLTISVRADGADSRRCAQSPREVLVWEPALETDATGGASVRLPPEGGGHGWRLVAVASTEAGQVAVVERKLLLLANDTACATGSGREVEKR